LRSAPARILVSLCAPTSTRAIATTHDLEDTNDSLRRLLPVPIPGGEVSPSNGLALARLYAARLLDAHETNLLRGLACAHTVPGADSGRLCALMWLCWATRGTFNWEMARALGPLSFRRAGLTRAGLALASLPADGAPER